MHRSAAAAGLLFGLIFAAVHLVSERLLTGGVVSHHLLADPELPAISNGFGLLTLPLLCAFAADRLARAPERPVLRGRVLAACLALAWGGGLALAFEFGADGVAQAFFLGLFGLALFLPVHRPECLAGFVLGMTFTFGGVLPVLVGSVVALASLILAAARRGLGRIVDGRPPLESRSGQGPGAAGPT